MKGLFLENADVRTGALADFVETPFTDLGRKERVSDRGSGRPDQVELAAAHEGRHRVGVGEAPHPDDGLLGDLPHA